MKPYSRGHHQSISYVEPQTALTLLMNIIDVNMLATSKFIIYTILLKYGSKATYNTLSLEPI
jgi:hypothetical protein